MAERLRGRAWQELTAAVLAVSSVCTQCGHLNADALDHVLPLNRGGTNDVANLKPIHHKPCPVCRISCNRVKGDRPPHNPSSRTWT